MSALQQLDPAERQGGRAIQLQKLNPTHRQVAAMLAQPGISRSVIAEAVGFTPEYISWLTKDPLFRDYQRGISDFVDAKLEAQYEKVADTIIETLEFGNGDEKLRAARLHLELTKRLGSGTGPASASESSVERLTTLAERLLALQSNVRRGETYNGEVQVVPIQSETQTG